MGIYLYQLNRIRSIKLQANIKHIRYVNINIQIYYRQQKDRSQIVCQKAKPMESFIQFSHRRLSFHVFLATVLTET